MSTTPARPEPAPDPLAAPAPTPARRSPARFGRRPVGSGGADSRGASTFSRRGFLGLGAAASGAALLAACGGTSTAADSPGVLRFGWQLPTSWDPITSSAGWDVHALSLVYAGLTQEDPQGNPVPALASGWTYNADGTQVTFTLRPGLTFSDGTALDATAVKKSLERSRDAKNSLVASQLTSVKTITAPTPTTVVIGLSEPNYQIPSLFAGKTGMIVSPAAVAANEGGLALRPVGAGPYTLTSYTQNAKATLVRNPQFWNAVQIKVPNFELYPLPDPSTVVAGLQSGQYNVAQIPGSQVDAAKAAGLQVQVIPSLVVAVLDVNTAMAPFDDPNVVLALKHAVDRKALLQTASFGYGDVAYQPFPKGYAAYNPALENLYPTDPDKAKALLAQSKYGPNPQLLITTSASAGVPEQLQGQLQAVGFRPTISVIPAAEATQIMYIQHSRALSVDQFAGRDAPAQAFQVLFSSTGLMNPSRRSNPELDAAVQKINATPVDSPQYPAVLQDATRAAVTTQPNTFLYTVPRILARSPNVSEIPAYTVVQRFEGVTVT